MRTNEQDKAKLAEQDHEGMTMTTDQPTISENPIDLARFSLSACDRVRIEMPPLSDVTEDDIDAQLFAYVANAPKDSPIKTLGDLDDAWVKANLPMYESIGEVRNAIRASLTKETTVAFDEIRYAKCAEALIERLEGDIPVAVIEAHAETVRARTEEAARAQGVSLARYLEDAHMTSEQYEASLLDEARHHGVAGYHAYTVVGVEHQGGGGLLHHFELGHRLQSAVLDVVQVDGLEPVAAMALKTAPIGLEQHVGADLGIGPGHAVALEGVDHKVMHEVPGDVGAGLFHGGRPFATGRTIDKSNNGQAHITCT